MSEPIVIPEGLFFRVRTAILEGQVAHAAALAELERRQAVVRAAMSAAGLDPAKDYVLDDATLTATLRVE